MDNKLNKGNRIFNRYVIFFFLTVFCLWIKTYLTQLTQFDLGVQGSLQKFLLFINPLGSSLLFLSIAFLFKERKKYIALMIIHGVLSSLLFANVVYYRFFNDFLTVPTLLQTQNFGNLGGSILSLLKPYDFLFFIDNIILISMLAFKVVKINRTAFRKSGAFAIVSLALGISFLTLVLSESDRPQLLTRGFDRNYIVKYLGLYNYTIYDAVESTKASTQRAVASSSDVTDVLNYTRAIYDKPNPEFFGKAKGMNVLYIHLESFQNFLINYKLNGQEVTPFLNSLVTNDQNTIYFDNFFHQTAQGKTSDAEFMLENSLFGLPQGSAYITKGQNTYQAMPAILDQMGGYSSAVFSTTSGSFWNRNTMYKKFGYTHFFDENYFQIHSDDTVEYGLLDGPFFQQSTPFLESLSQPFYAKLMTVTNHYPFTMNQDYARIAPANTGDPTVDGYFQTANYLDQSIEGLFSYLKDSGLLDHTVVVLYGDHYGISENHNKAMAKLFGKDQITALDNADLQKVPLIIRVPGVKGGVNHTYGGEIDVRPTLLHLLGIDSKDYIQFGSDLLAENHHELVPFRNGDFVSPNLYSINGKFYSPINGEELTDQATLQKGSQMKAEVDTELSLSDKVVDGDLLRFYTPNGFKLVDPSKYDYLKKEQKSNLDHVHSSTESSSDNE